MAGTVSLSCSGGTTNLKGSQVLTATPYGALGQITSAKFFINDVPFAGGTDTSAPYNYTWDTKTVADGAYQLKVQLFYTKNQVSESKLNVTVKNATAPPPPPPPPPNPPVLVVGGEPVISGTTTQGQTLSSSTGSWTNTPTRYDYQWERCDASGNNPVPIASAVNSSYTLAAADAGNTIRVSVTASNSAGPSAAAQSAATAVIAALVAAVPANTALPSITGMPVVGNILQVGNGGWTNSPTSYTRQWLHCGATSLKIGDTNVLSSPDSENGGLLVAQSAVLGQQATVQSLSFYVTTAAGNLRLGIYDDAGGRPGNKLAETAEITPAANSWNTAVVTAPVQLNAGTYWLAYLAQSSSLAFVKTTDASSSNRFYSFAYGALPATFSAAPTSDPAHFSFYATFSVASSCTNISGATATTYAVTSADVGLGITCDTIAINGAGSSVAARSVVTAAVTTPPPPPPPPPPGCPPATGPITISSGGTYTGHWVATGTTPAVVINTSQPVIITDSCIENTSTVAYGDYSLVNATAAGTQLTIQRTTLTGGNMKAITVGNFASFVLQNCNINKTWGIAISAAQSGASTVSITKNKFRNIDGFGSTPHAVQLHECVNITFDMSWNDIQNTFGQSFINDAINIYQAGGAHVHDNLVYGLYPRALGDSFSGAGIICDIGANNNEFDHNIIISSANEAVSIEGGHDNKIHDNRCVSDMKDDSGNYFNGPNGDVAIACYNGTGDGSWANNQVYNNIVGWLCGGNANCGGAGASNPYFIPGCAGNCSGNTTLPLPINSATEQAEYQGWLNKVAAAGVKIGV